MIWFLIDMDDGIIDVAEKKAILMWRYGFPPSRKVGKGYIVSTHSPDGIGHNYHIVKGCDIESEGFGWALEEYGRGEQQ